LGFSKSFAHPEVIGVSVMRGGFSEAMNVKYFRDTDTALIEFSNEPVHETREINENVYVDLDKDGNLVSMTIEHAHKAANLPTVVVEEIEQGVV
jgi:uncharacterized protein YuzE